MLLDTYVSEKVFPGWIFIDKHVVTILAGAILDSRFEPPSKNQFFEKNFLTDNFKICFCYDENMLSEHFWAEIHQQESETFVGSFLTETIPSENPGSLPW